MGVAALEVEELELVLKLVTGEVIVVELEVGGELELEVAVEVLELEVEEL